MATIKVSPTEIKAKVMEYLNNYQENVTENVKEEVAKVNRNALRLMKVKSPKRYGGYAQGWASKKAYEDDQSVRYVIHNKKKWQLTHLLEYGHIKWLWGKPTNERVREIPHIRPVEKHVQKALPEGIKSRLR